MTSRMFGIIGGTALLACSGSLDPADVMGSYSLTRVDGAPPPQVVSSGDFCDVSVVAGSLVLQAPDWSVLGLVRREVCITGDRQFPVVAMGTLRKLDNRLYFETTHTLTDTLRFPLVAVGSTVQLVVDDSLLGLPGPIHLGFTPSPPFEP